MEKRSTRLRDLALANNLFATSSQSRADLLRRAQNCSQAVASQARLDLARSTNGRLDAAKEGLDGGIGKLEESPSPGQRGARRWDPVSTSLKCSMDTLAVTRPYPSVLLRRLQEARASPVILYNMALSSISRQSWKQRTC